MTSLRVLGFVAGLATALNIAKSLFGRRSVLEEEALAALSSASHKAPALLDCKSHIESMRIRMRRDR